MIKMETQFHQKTTMVKSGLFFSIQKPVRQDVQLKPAIFVIIIKNFKKRALNYWELAPIVKNVKKILKKNIISHFRYWLMKTKKSSMLLESGDLKNLWEGNLMAFIAKLL